LIQALSGTADPAHGERQSQQAPRIRNRSSLGSPGDWVFAVSARMVLIFATHDIRSRAGDQGRLRLAD
jgi:hypothetical protein